LPLRELISGLQNPDPTVRRQAVERLGHIGGDEAAGALVLLLKDPDPGIRNLVGHSLAGFGPDAVGPLLRFLETWQGGADPVVPTLLGKLRTERGIDFLARHLSDPDPQTRSAIATALGRIGTDRTLPLLLELLRDMTDDVRIAAARALGELGNPATVDAMLDEMADENPAVRSAVAEALGRVNDQKSVDVLSRVCAEDPDPGVRKTAMVALRRVSAWAVNPLIHALAGSNIEERIRAVSQLLGQGKTAVLPLAELLANEDPTVRASAAEILGTLGDPAALDALIRGLNDADARVRLSATTAIGRVKHGRSAAALAPLLEDQDNKVAAAAANGLENLGELSVEPVFKFLNHQSAEVRVRAIDVLGRLRHRGACERLIRGLSDTVTWVRIVCAQALGEIGEIQASPALIQTLGDRDPVVRAMAAEALGKTRDFQATMPLLSALNDDSNLVRANALRALGRIGNPAALAFLKPALDSAEPVLKSAAIDGLASMRATEVLPQLRRMTRPWPLGRETREVREAARRAIDYLEGTLDQEEALGLPPEDTERTEQ
jgi:HEAT repeat protein